MCVCGPPPAIGYQYIYIWPPPMQYGIPQLYIWLGFGTILYYHWPTLSMGHLLREKLNHRAELPTFSLRDLKYYSRWTSDNLINRPGVARAVLQTTFSLINWLSHSSFSSRSSKHYNSQTVRARELKFWENIHPTPCVMCHVSCVMCHMLFVTCHLSPVTCHLSHVTWHMSEFLV